MNILDIVGAAIGLVFVFSEYKASRWLWPSSLLMAAFYAVINFRIGWFANMGICLYNFGISIYGLLVWRGILRTSRRQDIKTSSREDSKSPRQISSCPARLWPWIIAATGVLTLFFYWLLPLLGESNKPLLDGLSASLGIVGMWMLSQKYWEQWLFWLVSEPILAYIYFSTGYTASAIMYVIYEVFVIMGIIRWKKLSIS
ncbi:MAG: nicotinamide mononucleotide transporter [Bacteroidales bacterium]|nr:nicotinamide mononucleotide transporter [Bacteroidales bacterium]